MARRSSFRRLVRAERTSDGESLARDRGLRATCGLAATLEALAEGRRAEGRALRRSSAARSPPWPISSRRRRPARPPAEAVKARLAAQVAALMEVATFDPARLHQEAVLLATRADVREEIDRLRAHLAAARELLAAGGAVGRRLDFPAQELGREANTLCAKANDVALSRIGLEPQAVVEQFREQVQNIE